MPRQTNGSYQAPSGTAAVSGQPISSSANNTLETDIGNELTNSVDRLGRGAMQAALNMGSHLINAVAPGVAGTDAVNVAQLNALNTFPTVTSNGPVSISGAVATDRNLQFETSGLIRWVIEIDGAAESGANAGSNFNIASFNDAGTFLATVLSINRATAVVAFDVSPTVPTPTLGDNSQNAANTAFVTAAALVAVPAQAGDAGKVLTTNGTVTSWSPMAVSAQAGLVAVASASPTVTFSRNVSSVTRTGVGLWTVVLAGLNNANYTVIISGAFLIPTPNGKTSTGFNIQWLNSSAALADPTAGTLVDITVLGGL